MRAPLPALLLTVLLCAAAVFAAAPNPAEGEGVIAVAAGGSHTCVLTAAGGVKCWGSGLSGQLGNGLVVERQLTPVDVAGLNSGVAAIAAGDIHTCALTNAGSVKCWGSNFYGQLGATTTELCSGFPCSTTPVEVTGLGSGVAALARGAGLHACALTNAGGIKCWGRNEYGQLGDGTRGDGNSSTNDHFSTTPVDVLEAPGGPPLTGMGAVVVGANHSCAIDGFGAVSCWGANIAGGLGDGTRMDRTTPVDVVGLGNGVIALAAGLFHSCAVTAAGSLKCWGGNSEGQLGDGTNVFSRATPADVVGLTSGVRDVVAGAAHTCALTTGGEALCWGDNLGHGQVGDNGRCGLECHVPSDVCSPGRRFECAALMMGAAGVYSGLNHTCAADAMGAVSCWGANFFGQLGSRWCCDDIPNPVEVAAFEPKPTATPAGTATQAAAGTPTAPAATEEPPTAVNTPGAVSLPPVGAKSAQGTGVPRALVALGAGFGAVVGLVVTALILLLGKRKEERL